MSLNTRSVRSIYPSRLLLIDHGLSERTIQSICQGLDQLFSIGKTHVGLPRIPMFGLLVNGHNQSEVFLPFSSTRDNHMELQVALYKLQLLAQKWSMKSNRSNVNSSWSSALQLAIQELKTQSLKNRDNRFNSSANLSDVRIVILTNQLVDSNISEVQQFTRNHSLHLQNIELVYVNGDDEKKLQSLKQKLASHALINIKFLPENKYSIGLYFKSWLIHNDNDSEHLQLSIPTIGKAELVDRSWHVIRCDLHEILIDPRHHTHHDRFLIDTEPWRTPTLTRHASSLTLPIYQFKAINFIKQSNCCISLIFGMPLLVTSTRSKQLNIQSLESNDGAFHTLTEYLRQKELMLICRLADSTSSASEHGLILRSVASSELLLPLTDSAQGNNQPIDPALADSLAQIRIEEEEYNPLYYEARKSKITLDTNLI